MAKDVINFPQEMIVRKVCTQYQFLDWQVNDNVISILNKSTHFNNLLEIMKHSHPELWINTFLDIETCKIDKNSDLIMFKVKGVYYYASLNYNKDIDTVRSIEPMWEFIMEYWSVIMSWYKDFNLNFLHNMTDYFVDEWKNIIWFTVLWKTYTCYSLEREDVLKKTPRKPELKLVPKN